jgi:hypothetical protein
MPTDRETTRIVRSWLEDGRTALPDHVLDAVLDQVPATRQRRAWRPTRRYAQMNAYAKVLIAAAAVLVVAVIGSSLLMTRGETGATDPSGAPQQATTPPSIAPSASPDDQEATAPQPPVEFTGRIECGPPVANDRRGTEETVDVGSDGMTVTRNRGGAWSQTVEMSDPRLNGSVYETFESDTYTLPEGDGGPSVFAHTRRIENGEGAWEIRDYGGSVYDEELPEGAVAGVYVGEGAYQGLIAVVIETPFEGDGCGADVKGVIFDGAPVPEPYRP